MIDTAKWTVLPLPKAADGRILGDKAKRTRDGEENVIASNEMNRQAEVLGRKDSPVEEEDA